MHVHGTRPFDSPVAPGSEHAQCPDAHVGWFHISSRAVPRAHETRAHSYVVDEFILAMVPRVAARKDVVILEGTMGREMYLLSTGLMEVGQPWLMLL